MFRTLFKKVSNSLNSKQYFFANLSPPNNLHKKEKAGLIFSPTL